MQRYLLNHEEIELINRVRMLTTTQKTAITCAVFELAAQREQKALHQLPANVIPIPRRA